MKKIILMLFACFTTIVLYAQSVVTVVVNDATTRQPMPGVTVMVKGTTNGAATDGSGTVKVTCNGTDQLEVRFLGYQTQTIPVNNRSTILVALATESKLIGDVVIVGSRRPGRIKTETPVPVDIINVSAVSLPTGRMDLTSLMNNTAPSLNYNKQSGSDGADHIDLATLRGLGPDQTLVLINGKRRHQTAFVSVFGTRGRGNSGTDMNAIPISSIDRVEILRDGAAAQYGSDAIAGVINIILKKNVKEFTGDVGYGFYYDDKFNPAFKPEYKEYVYEKKTDGNSVSFNGNYGVPIGKSGGLVNFSLSYINTKKTYRQNLGDTAKFETDTEVLPLNIYRRANGEGSLDAVGAMINIELPIKNTKTTIYLFGGSNSKNSEAYAFTRNWSARPERFPTDANGNLIFVEGIMQIAGDSEIYFNPLIQSKITDLSFAAGARGLMGKGWNWDLSNNTGRNDFHFYGEKTFNASKGADQTSFDDGGFNFLQNTTNLNFNKEISGVLQGFGLAAGAEFRLEQYNLYAGEEASYKNYNPDKATGAQGFPGYQPADEVKASRNTIGAYVDAELDITKKFLVTGAVRVENYSDFGLALGGKFSTRYKFTDNFSLRASVSNGFRAPSLQQINFSSTFTTVQGGQIAEVKIAPNYSKIAKAAGIPELTQELSTNVSGGFTFSPIKNLNISVDGYMVKIKDRVVLSGQFDASDTTLNSELTTIMNDAKVSYAQFFANAVNTTNSGFDFIIDYKWVTDIHTLRTTFAGNIQKMTIDQINVPTKLNDTKEHRSTFLSEREQSFILASAPPVKFNFSFEYGYKKISAGLRLNYFGEITTLGYGEDGLGINPQVPTDEDENIKVDDKYVYGAKLVPDLFLSYKFIKGANLVLGVDNFMNVHPDLGAVSAARWWAFNNESAGPFDAVQMGMNGRRIYARLGFNF